MIDIPFAKHIGIKEEKSGLVLDFGHEMLNHIGTIHASAQFALAETQSGIYLQSLFPELVGKVVPVLRDAHIRYKRPAKEKIAAFASVESEEIERFRAQFEKKGRASIRVDVKVKDKNDILTCQATFTWFVQSI